ncbi:MAG: response regulator [Candidatus Manganitrophaceae bacterium]
MPDRELKILVVDDVPSMRKIIRKSLEQLGYRHFEEAEDGEAAWAKLSREPFGLIVCDWNMPKMDGLALLKAVRRDPTLFALPFLMVTTRTGMEHILDAIRLGVSGYILKPFTTKIMREKIDKIFKQV